MNYSSIISTLGEALIVWVDLVSQALGGLAFSHPFKENTKAQGGLAFNHPFKENTQAQEGMGFNHPFKKNTQAQGGMGFRLLQVCAFHSLIQARIQLKNYQEGVSFCIFPHTIYIISIYLHNPLYIFYNFSKQ